MTSQPYDAIVVGLGAAGAATVYQLACKGSRVLGIDRFDPPHTMGSTHGDTRITRLAIGEGAQYSPLAIRSHELWRDIERQTGADLLTRCGALYIAPDADDSVLHGRPGFLTRTQEAAAQYDIPLESLDAAQVRRRFPVFNMQPHERALFEPSAGFVRPEACVREQLALAAQLGANIHRNEQFLRFEVDGAGLVTVETTLGRYTARKLVLSMGPWIDTAVPAAVAPLFTIVRQTLVWFDIPHGIASFEPSRCPVHIWALADDHDIYGFPAVNGPHGGVKIATEQYATTTTADTVERDVSDAETSELYERFVAPCFPTVSARVLRTATCLYTVTPNFDFIIDSLPDQPQVIVVSPCSGHGFKHSAAIGESVASMVRDEVPRVSLKEFRAPWHHA